jgi:hypothetical protein
LASISAAVAGGNTDLKALGFWKLVGRAKRDPRLVAAYADDIGRIDQEAFEANNDIRFPIDLGNLVLGAGILAGFGLVWLAGFVHGTMAGVCFIAAAVVLSVAIHCPTHWLAGRFVHIQFTSYLFDGPFPPRPGLKTDYASYLRATANGRAWMHASGALMTKLMPFLVLAFYRKTNAPLWAAFIVLIIGWGQIGTDIFLSTKTSDWKKVRRELRVAKELSEKK